MGDGKSFPVIGVLPGKVITGHLTMDLPARSGEVLCDPAQDAIRVADLPLPIAGLMSDKAYEDVRDQLVPLRKAAKSLGTVLAEPFLQVAFLPMPVIPHLKISDRGLVDVDAFRLL